MMQTSLSMACLPQLLAPSQIHPSAVPSCGMPHAVTFVQVIKVCAQGLCSFKVSVQQQLSSLPSASLPHMHRRLPDQGQCFVKQQKRCCRSKQAKAAPGVSTAAPDVEYNADKLHKATLVTAMRDSPILYGNMRHSRTQRSGLGHSTACSADVGPGTYNAVMQKDVRTSLLLPTNPLSR